MLQETGKERNEVDLEGRGRKGRRGRRRTRGVENKEQEREELGEGRER